MSETPWLFEVTKELINYIFSGEDRRLLKAEAELVNENQKLSPPNQVKDGFFYKGLLFSNLEPSIRNRGTKGNLVSSLVLRAEAHYRDIQEVEFDKDRCRQALALILSPCRSNQDIRDALPNSLKDVLARTRGLSRTREEAYTVRDNPRAYKQYLKLRDKIEFYNAAKLLY